MEANRRLFIVTTVTGVVLIGLGYGLLVKLSESSRDFNFAPIYPMMLGVVLTIVGLIGTVVFWRK